MVNCRRTQSDGGWSHTHKSSLVVLLQCCMPSLLSLYPTSSTKDICFQARVAIYTFFQKIMKAGHEKQNEVYVKLRPLIRTCLIEYTYFYVMKVTNVPYISDFVNIRNQALATCAHNMGQQLRVEINTKYFSMLSANKNVKIFDVLMEMNDTCQVMYERTSRSSKTILHGKKLNHVPMKLAKRSARRGDVAVDISECARWSHDIPYTESFAIFEMICKRRNIPESCIMHIWEAQKCIRVFELTAEIMQRQVQALCDSGFTSSLHMKKKCCIVVCMFCVQNNHVSSLRANVRNGQFVCNRCDVPGTCVEIDLLGRVVVINKIPYVLSTCCCRVVVFGGMYKEFMDRKCCTGKHVFWSDNSVSVSFTTLLNNVSPMQVIGPSDLITVSDPTKYATREFMIERQNGNTSYMSAQAGKVPTCCMCSSRCSQAHKLHRFLDIYNEEFLFLPVCARHDIPVKWSGINVKTIQKYLEIFKFYTQT